MNLMPILNKFLRGICVIIVSMFVLACSKNDTSSEDSTRKAGAHAPRVIVLGMVHSAHIESKVYSLPFLRKIIETINPDYILTEIPPDRFDEAMTGFLSTGKVTEPRVARFPEYVDVIFPLLNTMNFEIIPTAAWTQPMAEFRATALTQIANAPDRRDDWNAHIQAEDVMSKKLKGKEDDPFYIHTDEYDEIIKQGLTPYATRFAGDLGTGDWEQINNAHFELINAAINNIIEQNQSTKKDKSSPKTILITFGAAHKYWYLERLKERKDIKLISARPFIEMAAQSAP